MSKWTCTPRSVARLVCVLSAGVGALLAGRAEAQMSYGDDLYRISVLSTGGGGGRSVGGTGDIYESILTIGQPGGVGTVSDDGAYDGYSGYGFASLGAIASLDSEVQHGTAGSFALPLDRMKAIEPRRTTDFSFTVRFLAQMTALSAMDPAAVEVTGGEESYTPTAVSFVGGGNSGLVLQIDVDNNGTPFPNKTVYTVNLTDLTMVTATGLQAKLTHGIECRVGDVNQDGFVEATDWGAIKSVNRMAVTADEHPSSGIPMFLYDTNSDGRLNLIDAALARGERDD